ncbi:unnamed protein product [Discosporangium mesarthrocarpum]
MDCGLCGGVGCGAVTGTRGASDCCPTDIRAAGQYCGAGVVAPCLIDGFTPSPVNPALVGTSAPVVYNQCEDYTPGFQDGAACCKMECGQCGGPGCGTIPGTGGPDNCCSANVIANNVVSRDWSFDR